MEKPIEAPSRSEAPPERDETDDQEEQTASVEARERESGQAQGQNSGEEGALRRRRWKTQGRVDVRVRAKVVGRPGGSAVQVGEGPFEPEIAPEPHEWKRNGKVGQGGERQCE
ncbi:MAG TPA: hypothetical protein VIG29_17465, partial [Vicinamibacteria bacterium]